MCHDVYHGTIFNIKSRFHFQNLGQNKKDPRLSSVKNTKSLLLLMERTTRFELAILGLGSQYSTAEPRPQDITYESL